MGNIARVLALMSILTVFPSAVFGQVTWNTGQMIEDNVGHSGGIPQVAISGNNVVAIWRQNDGSGYRIYVNHSTDGGGTWGADQLIEDNSGNHAYEPQVVISGNNVVAVWRQNDGSDYYRIYANHSTDGGVSWGSDQLIEDNAGNDGLYPQVAISGNNVVAVWRKIDGDNNRIYANHSADGGATWGADQLIEDNAGGNFPQVAISGNKVVAVWQQYDGSGYRICANHSTDGGATWSADQLIENNAGIEGNATPQVVISGNKVVAVWRQYDGNNYRIYANYSADGGATWGADQFIEDNAGSDGSPPQVAISGNNVVAVWRQISGINYSIYANHSTDGGATWNADQLIEDNAGIEGNATPQVAISGNNVVAVWRQNDLDYGIISADYSADGGATWGIDQLLNNANHSASSPQVAISGNNVVAVWQQSDGSNTRIYSTIGIIEEQSLPVAGPDLTGTWTSMNQSCKNYRKGIRCKIKSKITIQNIGNEDASSSVVRYYLSKDDTFDAGDTLLKQINTGKIKKGKSKNKSFSYTSPYGILISGKYIIAVMDADHTSAEINENNNMIVFGPTP